MARTIRMTLRGLLLVLCLGFLFLVPVRVRPAESAEAGVYWPGRTWRTSTPEAQGLSSRVLVHLMEDIKERGIGADEIILVRNGYIVLDATFYPFTKGSVHDVASVTKSITSTAIGIAADQGLIKGARQPVLSFFPERKAGNLDERKRTLTLENLLTMTSGFCRNIDEGERQTGLMGSSGDGLQYMLDHPLVSKPGSDFVYCSLSPHLLSAVLTRAAGMSLQVFAEKNLFAPLGIEGVLWDVDPQGNSHGWGDLFIRPVDLAKIGYLFLNGGRWKGRQVVSREWVTAASKPRVFEPGGTGYGYLWWVPKEPAGLYEGRGRGGQRLAIWPQKNMVVVLIGSGDYTLGGIGGILVSAVKADGPLPEDTAYAQLLTRKVTEAGEAPAPHPVEALPAFAKTISGRDFAMEPNPLGLKAFSLTFGGSTEAIFKLSIGKEEKVIPVGLDGVYRIANTSSHQLPAGALGKWVSDRDFKVDYRESAGNKSWHFTLHFNEDWALCSVTESTGLIDDVQIKAKARSW